MIAALVFDFDGLILDTEVAALRAWQELFAEHGCELPLVRWTAGIRLGARPEQAIAFEDSPNGARAARAAGIFTVAVPNPVTAALAFDEADLRLGSFEELPLTDLLERIAGRTPA